MEKDIRDQSNWNQQKRSYENSPWINVHDWQVTKHTNGKTNEDFWDVKLAKGTFIDVEGKRVDVSGYHFHANYEPSVSFGEPGTPRCKRGIRFPEDWNITLQRFENTASAGEPPVFVEVERNVAADSRRAQRPARPLEGEQGNDRPRNNAWQ